jgi:hypothetical protein
MGSALQIGSASPESVVMNAPGLSIHSHANVAIFGSVTYSLESCNRQKLAPWTLPIHNRCPHFERRFYESSDCYAHNLRDPPHRIALLLYRDQTLFGQIGQCVYVKIWLNNISRTRRPSRAHRQSLHFLRHYHYSFTEFHTSYSEGSYFSDNPHPPLSQRQAEGGPFY